MASSYYRGDLSYYRVTFSGISGGRPLERDLHFSPSVRFFDIGRSSGGSSCKEETYLKQNAMQCRRHGGGYGDFPFDSVKEF